MSGNKLLSVLASIVAVFFLSLPVAAQASNTIVRMQTVLGVVDIKLFDTQAPQTVANFLAYAASGAYNNSFMHRSVPGFIIQGGGFRWDSGPGLTAINTTAPVINEFSPDRSNLRGTMAMAKLSGDPNSATSQWFFNLGNNAANLDTQNGGFTVFGQVFDHSMVVVDALATLRRVNASGAFTDLPVISVPTSGQLDSSHLAMLTSVSVLPAGESINLDDRLFNYLEAAFPQFIAPASQPTVSAAGMSYRHYPASNAYVGTDGTRLLYLGPATGNILYDLGARAEWHSVAIAAGY